MKWTEEQQKVIDVRGKNILVSAAAGSGKTAVLVERILSMITDEKKPVDIDRLLVVTFTNAAAAEMRERIRDALERRADEAPDHVHLQRQLVLVHNAKITTIHSFCLHVLRNHFQLAGIDPSFRVADEGEVLLLEQEAVADVVKCAYAQYMKANAREDDGEEVVKPGERRAETEEADKEIYKETDEINAEEFREFLERFSPGKSDQVIEQTILSLYHFALGQPWPRLWLQQCRSFYDGRPDEEYKSAWLSYIVEDTKQILADAEAQVQEALRIAEEPDGPYPYQKALLSDLELIKQLRTGSDYESYAGLFRNMAPYTRLGTKKDAGISEEKKLLVQGMRAAVKDTLSELRQRYYYDSVEVLYQELSGSGGNIRVLTHLTEALIDTLAERKAEKNILDFGDLEHLALQVLVEHRNGENIPTAAAREYAESFEEIMIDEYQDSNLVQELILGSVSGKGEGAQNLFMVGDVKQSIYRFRLARPELFMEKYKTYQEEKASSCRIDLHRNFRSRAEVLDGINYIFRQIMTEKLGGIVYDEDAALYPGAVFEPRPGESEGCLESERRTEDIEQSLQPNPDQEQSFLDTEFLLLETEGAEKQREEAGLVGRRICEIVGREHVWDKETACYRPARYSDIVILLRTVTGWSDAFGEVLGEMGIPCFTGSRTGYFSAVEIRIVLSYLQILDNPVQDIPFAAVLRSAIGNVEDEELAMIRCFSDQKYFYDCCRAYQKNGTDAMLREKLEQFFDVYERLRAKCAYTPVYRLIWELLEVTGYGEYVQALPAGEQRKANLDMLVEKAIAYEATSYRGLYHFVHYIDNLKKYEMDYGEASIGQEASDTVRIMSIHKSKGLEFPVVFVCGLGKKFNESDIRSRVVMHPEFGIACDYVDLELRTRQATLLKKVIQHKTTSENLGEELRVLYVALTRAKEKLILTGAIPDAVAAMEKWKAAALYQGESLSYSWLFGASTYLDWLGPALLRHPSSWTLFDAAEVDPGETVRSSCQAPPYHMQLVSQQEHMQQVFEGESDKTVRLGQLLQLDTDICYDQETHEYLEQVFTAVYPHEGDGEIIGKLSVSELKKLSRIPDEAESEELYQPETVVPLIPVFRQEKQPLAGAARGTAYHAFMENLDYSRKEELELQLEELVRCGKMSQEESNALCLDDVRRFLKTQSGVRMERAARNETLFRERPFVLGVPANEIRSGWNPQEIVLVQGIIDAYFLEEGQISVLDYKTDRVNHPQELVDKYRAQLDYYARALGRLTGCKVKDKIIYSFHLGEDIVL